MCAIAVLHVGGRARQAGKRVGAVVQVHTFVRTVVGSALACDVARPPVHFPPQWLSGCGCGWRDAWSAPK